MRTTHVRLPLIRHRFVMPFNASAKDGPFAHTLPLALILETLGSFHCFLRMRRILVS